MYSKNSKIFQMIKILIFYKQTMISKLQINHYVMEVQIVLTVMIIIAIHVCLDIILVDLMIKIVNNVVYIVKIV